MEGIMGGKKQVKKKFPVLPVAFGIVILCLAFVYAGGVIYYQNHFVNGTVIDRVDVSGMTIEELSHQIQDYMLQITERKTDGGTLDEDIQGSTIGLSYSSTEPLEQILKNQNVWEWFLRQDQEYELQDVITYDQAALTKAIENLKGFDTDFAAAPTDAYISDYVEGTGFSIVPETQGNQLKKEQTIEAIRAAVESLHEKINLDEEGCYEAPEVTADNEKLQATLQKMQKYADLMITYTFGEQKEVLDGATVSSWLHVDGFEVKLDTSQVENYVAALRKKYDTIFRSRTFMTSYGKEITIDGGDYGWWMNYDQEAKELEEMIENGESGERTPVYYQTAASYGTPDYGNTYVEINLTAQHLFFYQDGQLMMESDFVSGNSAKGYDTPAGVYSITYKQRDATLKGENYETPVSYWMPFNRNIGMHDASWRSDFGGTIYKTKGSHGCINMPPAKAQEMYGYVQKGTPVICYHLAGTERASEQEKGAPSEGSEAADTSAETDTAQ